MKGPLFCLQLLIVYRCIYRVSSLDTFSSSSRPLGPLGERGIGANAPRTPRTPRRASIATGRQRQLGKSGGKAGGQSSPTNANPHTTIIIVVDENGGYSSNSTTTTDAPVPSLPVEAASQPPTQTPTVPFPVPATASPSVAPTVRPTASPTARPTAHPTGRPTARPTPRPSAQPTGKSGKGKGSSTGKTRAPTVHNFTPTSVSKGKKDTRGEGVGKKEATIIGSSTAAFAAVGILGLVFVNRRRGGESSSPVTEVGGSGSGGSGGNFRTNPPQFRTNPPHARKRSVEVSRGRNDGSERAVKEFDMSDTTEPDFRDVERGAAGEAEDDHYDIMKVRGNTRMYYVYLFAAVALCLLTLMPNPPSLDDEDDEHLITRE